MPQKNIPVAKKDPIAPIETTPPEPEVAPTEVIPVSKAHLTDEKAALEATPSPKPDFFDDFHDKPSNKKYRYILFAIFALILLGVVFLLKPSIESLLKPTSNPESYIPVSQEPKSMHLEINNPDDELLTFDKTINISGKTSPKSSVVISNGDLNWGIDASVQGDFSKVIDLKSGINSIYIYAFDPQGNNKVESRTIFMSEEKL